MDILHLEDSANDAALVEVLVRGEWPDCRIVNVATRAQYETAIELGNFDLIVSDYAMPGYDGLAALEIARTWCPEKPFIFMSGTLGEERAIEALQSGAADYVIKDRPGRLIPAIRQALSRVAENARRQRVEDALRQNRERFRQITENVADMIAVLDLEGRRVYLNPACRELFGDAAECVRPDAFDAIHPEDRERIRAIFFQTIRTGAKHRAEYRLLPADGSVRHIESQNSVIRDAAENVIQVLVVARDVTERKRSEDRVRELAALLEKARDAIFVRDLDQRHITYWNPGAERLYGWTAAEVAGRPAGDLFEAEETDEPQGTLRAVLENGEWSGELRQRDKLGREITVMARRTLLRDARGRPVSILNINTDVTEQRRLEAQVLRNQRMESIGSLTGGIAHDLNNVLSPILMGAELLGYSALEERDRKTVEAIAGSARHGAALVGQLLAFARGTEGARTVVQMDVLCAELEPLLRQTLSKSVTLVVARAADCWPILADATQVKQILLNLCINARDAMPTGGRIAMATTNVLVDAEHARSLPDGRPGAHLRINVSDTGTGMAPEVVEKIFDPFFTTKAPGKGTGLGLSTVRGIIKGHGGFIEVESEPGRGTTFHIYLPVLRAEALAGPAPTAAKIPAGRGETVLVAHPDPGIHATMRPLLEHHGYRVVTAGDGREALGLLEKNHEEIAVVLADLTPPEMNGVELIAEMRTLAPTTPVITIGSLGRGGKPVPGLDRVAVAASLDKPLDANRLLEALRRVVGNAGGDST